MPKDDLTPSHNEAMSKLNGWQRLWVLVTLLWLFAVVAGSWTIFPTDERQVGSARALNAEVRQLFNPNPAPSENCFQYNDLQALKDCTKAKLDQEALQWKRADEDEEKITERVDREGHEVQALFVAKAVAWWLIPALCVYLLGLGVWWVRRGFGGQK